MCHANGGVAAAVGEAAAAQGEAAFASRSHAPGAPPNPMEDPIKALWENVRRLKVQVDKVAQRLGNERVLLRDKVEDTDLRVLKMEATAEIPELKRKELGESVNEADFRYLQQFARIIGKAQETSELALANHDRGNFNTTAMGALSGRWRDRSTPREPSGRRAS